MDNKFISAEEFGLFKKLLVNKLDHIEGLLNSGSKKKEWYKSSELKSLLSISHGTLQSLRDSNELPYTKVRGILFYHIDDINELLEKNLVK